MATQDASQVIEIAVGEGRNRRICPKPDGRCQSPGLELMCSGKCAMQLKAVSTETRTVDVKGMSKRWVLEAE